MKLMNDFHPLSKGNRAESIKKYLPRSMNSNSNHAKFHLNLFSSCGVMVSQDTDRQTKMKKKNRFGFSKKSKSIKENPILRLPINITSIIL